MPENKDNLRGIVLMLGAMAVFAVEDMFLKLAAYDLPTGELLLLSALFGFLFFWAMARRQGVAILTRAALHPAVMLRNGGEMVGTTAYIMALSSVDLSLVSSVFQALPLAVTMGAALFMGERVGWRRWTAIAIGFLGVLIIIRPGFDGFQPQALWVLVTVAATALRDLSSRAIPRDCSTAQISAWGLGSITVLGATMMIATGEAVTPSVDVILWLMGAIVFGTIGYWAIIGATRTGDVSVVSPFRYSRLIFAILVGVVVFDETIDGATITGAALIIGSGLYSLARQAARKRALSIQN